MPNVLCEEAKSAVAVRLLPAASVVPGRREPAHVVQMWLHMRLPRAKKQLQAFTPLGQQLNSVYEYKRADRATRDERRCDDGLSECRWCAWHTIFVSGYCRGSGFLIGAERPVERDVDCRAFAARIDQHSFDVVLRQQQLHRVQATARQCNVVGEVLRAADHARRIPNGPSHCLRLVELRILEGSDPHKAVGQGLRQLGLRNVKFTSSGWPSPVARRVVASTLR